MKNLILVLFLGLLSISLPSFSQTITIDVFETQPYVKWEKTLGENVLNTPEWTGYKEPANGTYILDLDNMTIQHIHDGKLVSTDKIEKLEIKGDNFHIEFNGDTEVSGIKFQGQFDFNSTSKESSLSWYNSFGEYTRVQKNTKTKVSVSKKLEI